MRVAAAEHQELRLEPLCGEEDGEETRGNMIGLFYLLIAAAVHVAGRAAQIPFARSRTCAAR